MTTNSPQFATVLASTIHDMKNSLGLMLQSLEALLDELPDENLEQQDRGTILRYEAARINTSLVQLLALYQLDNNLLAVHLNDNVVIEILEDQIAHHRLLLDAKKIDLKLSCDEEMMWVFDPNLVGGAINNILNNTVRYAAGRISITASAQPDGGLLIEINDDGSGYPEKMLARSREDSGVLNFATGNTGLGLFFSEQVARLHQRGGVTGRSRIRNGGDLGGGLFQLWIP